MHLPPSPFEAPVGTQPGPQPGMPEYGVAPQLTAGPPPRAAEPPMPGAREAVSMAAPQPIYDVYAAPMPMPTAMPSQPWPEYVQAVGEFPESGGHNLGLTLLADGLGAALGGYYWGAVGAGIGVLAGGAAINTWRALDRFKEGSDEGDKEGRVSAAYALVGAGVATFLWWRYVRSERMHANPDDGGGDDDGVDEDTDFGGRSCAIRPAGP